MHSRWLDNNLKTPTNSLPCAIRTCALALWPCASRVGKHAPGFARFSTPSTCIQFLPKSQDFGVDPQAQAIAGCTYMPMAVSTPPLSAQGFGAHHRPQLQGLLSAGRLVFTRFLKLARLTKAQELRHYATAHAQIAELVIPALPLPQRRHCPCRTKLTVVAAATRASLSLAARWVGFTPPIWLKTRSQGGAHQPAVRPYELLPLA